MSNLRFFIVAMTLSILMAYCYFMPEEGNSVKMQTLTGTVIAYETDYHLPSPKQATDEMTIRITEEIPDAMTVQRTMHGIRIIWDPNMRLDSDSPKRTLQIIQSMIDNKEASGS